MLFNLFLSLLFLVYLKSAVHVSANKHHHRHQKHHHKVIADELVMVNGLKNKEVAVMVHSTWGGWQNTNGRYYRERVYASIRTWMRDIYHVYVIIEDTHDARMHFRNCPYLENENFTSFSCPSEPTVILSRICVKETENRSHNFCCKVEQSISYLAFSEPEVYKNIKYVLFGDDDYYFRIDRILLWLSYIENANISHIPLISNSNTNYNYKYDRTVAFGWKPMCKEIVTYGWYGANVFNKAALNRLVKASESNAFIRTCAIWGFAQDVGLGLYGWLLQLSHVNMPGGIQIDPTKHTKYKSYGYLRNNIVFHHVYNPHENGASACDTPTWPKHLRYNQEHVIGCGTMNQPIESNGLTMYQIRAYFNKSESKDELVLPQRYWKKVEGKKYPVPVIRPLVGYNQTKHYKNNKILEKWVDYTPADCDNFDSVLYTL